MPEAPKPPADWYDDPDTENQLRYWDGSAWTDHTSPANTPPPPTSQATATGTTRACPYCTVQIPNQAVRCSHCAGDLKYCSRCKEIVGMSSKQKFVGMARGGMKTQYRCMKCSKTLDGPRI